MSDNNFEPDWMSAPGATISAMLERRRLQTVEEFAELHGLFLPKGQIGCSMDVLRSLAKSRNICRPTLEAPLSSGYLAKSNIEAT